MSPFLNGTILAMTLGIALLVAFVVPLQICAANAAPGPSITTARLQVRSSPDCATREDLVTRVAARSPRVRFSDDDAMLAVEAVFTAGRTGSVVGELVMTGPDGKPSSRRMLARSCAEAADAVALIIAVTLDPTSVSDSRAAAAPQATSTSPANASTSAAAAPVSTVAATPSGQPAGLVQPPVAPVTVNPIVDPSAAPSVASHRRVSVTLAGQTIFGPAPAAMPGVSLYAMAALDREALWSPAIIIGATHVWRNGFAETGGTAAFALDAASIDACAFRLRLSVVEARACGSALVGRLTASGADAAVPARHARPFASAGAVAVLTAGLGSMVELSARLGTGITLVRDSYKFTPSRFHQAAPFTTSASLGIGVRLP